MAEDWRGRAPRLCAAGSLGWSGCRVESADGRPRRRTRVKWRPAPTRRPPRASSDGARRRDERPCRPHPRSRADRSRVSSAEPLPAKCAQHRRKIVRRPGPRALISDRAGTDMGRAALLPDRKRTLRRPNQSARIGPNGSSTRMPPARIGKPSIRSQSRGMVRRLFQGDALTMHRHGPAHPPGYRPSRVDLARLGEAPAREEGSRSDEVDSLTSHYGQVRQPLLCQSAR